MSDDRIAEIVRVSPPGAAIEVHEIRLTEAGQRALTILRPPPHPPRVSPLAWLPVLLVVVTLAGGWGLICVGAFRAAGAP